MRSGPKRLAEAVLAGLGSAQIARAAHRGRSLILAYHNVVPDQVRVAGDASLHLRQSAFGEQLDRIRRSFEVVPLEEALDGRATRARRLAITFDDAYRGALTLGLEELERRRLPATVFVAPARLGTEGFWWDRLASEGGLDDTIRDRALQELEGDTDRILAWAEGAGRLPRPVAEHLMPATLAELSEADRSPLIRVASHSWSHPNLTRIGASRLTDELGVSRSWLAERFASFLPWLSYPYGLSDARVESAARAAGYRAALRIDGGWVPKGKSDRFALPRLNVPAGVSAAGFDLRTAGLVRA